MAIINVKADKVANGGTTPEGRLTFAEVNELVKVLVAKTNINALVEGANIGVDAAKGWRHDLTLNANGRNINNPINGFDGQTITFAIKQGANATADGGYTPVWGNLYVGGNTMPIDQLILSQESGAIDYITFKYNESVNKWHLWEWRLGY